MKKDIKKAVDMQNNNIGEVKNDNNIVNPSNEIKETEIIKKDISENVPPKTEKVNPQKQKNGWVTFGVILSIFAFILSMYNLVAKLSFLIVVFYYLVLFIIMFFTLFTILANENFKKFLDGGESLINITSAIQVAVPYTASIAGVFSIASIIMLSLQKNYKGGKKVLGIVFSSISLVITIIVLALHYTISY